MSDDPFESAAEDHFRRDRARKEADGADGEGSQREGTSDGENTPPPLGRAGAPKQDGPPRAPQGRGSVPRVGERPIPASLDAKPEVPLPDLSKEAEAARGAPDYVGDYPHSVPRWEPEKDAVPARRGDGEPDGLVEPSPAGAFQPGPSNARLCYLLLIGGVFLPILPLIGGAMAWMNRSRVGPDLASHYTYALRTVGLGAVAVIGINLATGGRLQALGLMSLLFLIWWMGRSVRGLMRLGSGRAIPNPLSWFF